MKAKVFKYKFDGNTVVAPYMELEPWRKRINTGMKTMITTMWSARLETSIFLAGNICGEYLTWNDTGKKPPAIAGTGSRTRFRMQQTGTMSPFYPSVFLKNSDLTRLPCCKPVRRTGKNRSRGNWSKKKKKRNNAS